jgi:hypothetical protein
MQTKIKKRIAAEQRNATRKARTRAAQLALLATRPGEAKRERARLAKIK